MSFIAKISLPLRKSKTRGDHIVFITMDVESNTTNVESNTANVESNTTNAVSNTTHVGTFQ